LANDPDGTFVDLSAIPGAVSNQLSMQVPYDALGQWMNPQGMSIFRFQVTVNIADSMRTFMRFLNTFHFSWNSMSPAAAKKCVIDYFGTVKLFTSAMKNSGQPPPANLTLCIKAYFRMFGYNIYN
jgi:hypothetical protein